jgi:hypothetical protein
LRKLTNPAAKSGRKLLGSILKDLRRDSGLPTKFAADGPLKMRDTMIRMIENGHADLPVNKVHGYAKALNEKARGAWMIDPSALALAYGSVRSLEAGQPTGKQFNWNDLNKNPDARAEVLARLIHVGAGAERAQSSKNYPLEFEYLNPIQRQMVIDIARRIGVLGSDIVTDEALAEWESANVGQITRVLVATTSLGSELQDDFIKSITAISQSTEFSEWRYLLATADAQSFAGAVKAFKQALHDFKQALQDSGARAKERSNLKLKFNIKRITLDEYEQVEKSMGSSQGRGWDGLYLYNVKYGQDLLIGAFRRCPSLHGVSRSTNDFASEDAREPFPVLTPVGWGCVPVNEALRWSSIAKFTQAHDDLWDTIRSKFQL